MFIVQVLFLTEKFHPEQQSYPHYFCNTFGKQNLFDSSVRKIESISDSGP